MSENRFDKITKAALDKLASMSVQEFADMLNKYGEEVHVGEDGFIHYNNPIEPDMLDKLSTQVELLVKKGDDYLADFLREVTSHIVHLQMDHDYYQAVVEGKWPNSDDIIKRSRGQSDDTQTRVDES